MTALTSTVTIPANNFPGSAASPLAMPPTQAQESITMKKDSAKFTVGGDGHVMFNKILRMWRFW